VPLLSNKWIWLAAFFSLALQAVLMYTPAHIVFKIAALSPAQLIALAVAGMLFYFACAFYQHLVGSLNNRSNA
jgi:hypothetical protein